MSAAMAVEFPMLILNVPMVEFPLNYFKDLP
jgi:hypothetical protein